MTGLTYVLLHPGFRAVKVGYTTPRAKRLTGFGRGGWQVYRMLEVATHGAARDVEQAALFEIRFRKLVPPYLTREQMPLLGWTETFSLGLISLRETWDIVCEQASLLQLAPQVGRPPDGRRNNGGTSPVRKPGDTPSYSPLARRQIGIERTATKDLS
jgi:hypothetical protein